MQTPSRHYEDILEPRRNEFSNFMWVSRELRPQIAYKQPSRPTSQYHKDEVLKSRKIQELLTKLSQEQGILKEELENQVRNILDEIGYNKNLKVIRWLGLALAKICQRICTGIFVNMTSVISLKSQIGNCPVVFVPSHRSYADFILMSLTCFSEDLAIPAIAAGMDFHGMWGMGAVLRDTGAFFMRRSYNDDNLYWNTFKQYIYQIVTKGELPIEFFIEGTRSRSGKSLSPKYGLILMVLKAFFLSQVPDILFVPINISYDRVLEENLFAFELLGIPKPKETTMGFFKSLSIIKENYGRIFLDFAEPISAKDFFGNKFDRSEHNLQPLHQQEITENEKKLIPALAHQIIYQQQKHCVITTFNLISLALANNLTNGNDLFNLDGLTKEVVWLERVAIVFGAHVDLQDARRNVLEALDVHHNVVSVNEVQEVTLVWNKIALGKFDPAKLKAHDLSEKTINFSIPFVMLQLYVNPTLHYLVDAAILVIVLKFYNQRVTRDELFGHYHFLRSLLSQEFVTFSPREKMEFDDALMKSLDLNLIQLRSDGFYELGQNRRLEELLCTCLDCFIYTYFVVCCVLQNVSDNCDENSILAKVQAEIEVGIDDSTAFIHPYSLSLDTITNCLNSLSVQGVLVRNRTNGSVSYRINKNEVLFIKSRLEHCIPSSQVLQRKLESVQLHLKTKL